MSKPCIALLEKLTLPQLELIAAVLGARIASYLRKQLRIHHIVFWSDSQIVLYWFCSDKELKWFTENRVGEIRQLTNNASWRYCPSSDNPADLLTRGIQAQTLASFQLWKNGPAWLTQETNWPRWEPNSVLLQVSDPATSQQRNLQTPDDQPQPTPPKVTGITEMIDHTKFSCLQKLVCTTAWVMHLINMARKREVNKGKSLT